MPSHRQGYVDDSLDGGSVSVNQGDAEFGFTSACNTALKGKPRSMITGENTYHGNPGSVMLEGDLERTVFPEIRLDGTVEPLVVPNVGSCEDVGEGFPGALREALTDLRRKLFNAAG